jgi:hypothetical protein
MLRPAHRRGGIGRYDLTGDQQSKSVRIAASCSLTDGAETSICNPSI